MKKRSLFFLFPFTLLLTLFLALPWVSAKEPPKPKPEAWQINGIVAALDDGHDGLTLSGLKPLRFFNQRHDLLLLDYSSKSRGLIS